MKFSSTRELRNRPRYVRGLVKKDDLVLTTNGELIAIFLGIEQDELEETACAILASEGAIGALSSSQTGSTPRRQSHVGLRC